MKKQNIKQIEDNTMTVKIFVIISILLFLIFGFLSSNKESVSSNIYFTNANCFVSYSKESLKKLARNANHNDSEATQQLLNSGEIFIIPEKQEVYILDSDFSGYVKVKLKGNNEEVWTIRENLIQ